ncbi:hypothetical protein [Burkholderia sp. Ac-20384]|uniref:hypothetical protein n=1 Tax=Burkholderia sp. Ac-20384 TaxID=2703902 RepID=UPI001F11DD4E|nr:hypothetical protein [Burkholderia sp. Ac-20384]
MKITIEQADAEIGLEIGERRAHRRLRLAEPPRGSRQPAVLGDCDEDREMIERHVGYR